MPPIPRGAAIPAEDSGASAVPTVNVPPPARRADADEVAKPVELVVWTRIIEARATWGPAPASWVRMVNGGLTALGKIYRQAAKHAWRSNHATHEAEDFRVTSVICWRHGLAREWHKPNREI